MENDKTLFNKVTASGIISLDLLQYKPEVSIVEFDISAYLFMQMVLKEKDFRDAMANLKWEDYMGKAVSIVCKTDAIVPQWSYMYIASLLFDKASSVIFGSNEQHEIQLWIQELYKANFNWLDNKKVVVKANAEIPQEVYVTITSILLKRVASLMYGEPGMPKMIFKNKIT